MSLGPKVHAIIASLVFALALATAPSGHAQRLSTENWGQWNAASIPIYPDETWRDARGSRLVFGGTEKRPQKIPECPDRRR
jgi:hypothetical protein